MTDHTPSPAMDGLREAIEALTLRLSSRYARLCTVAQGDWETLDGDSLAEADILSHLLTELRAVLAAHPATETEGQVDE